ncbi:MAG: hypothetical protein NC923_05735, partial [Candidatus Omnitrophica bacterium]|nr:hypothetical protein [Candidatus Omnitrophota bacterium]
LLPAYKVGGVYLRFKREQVWEFKKKNPAFASKVKKPSEYPFRDRLWDFFYFYDFYILSAVIIAILLFILFRG